MPGDTRERIAQAALSLFSRHGFAAVSIRDICRDAGIKESTVYYHYTNKQAILDELLSRVDSIALQKQALFDEAFGRAVAVSAREMAFVAVDLLDNYLLHPSIFPLIRMLCMERIHDEAAERRYQHIVFDMPLANQAKVFGQMAEKGMIQPCDAAAASAGYYGIIYSAFARFCLGAGGLSGRDGARRQIEAGVLHWSRALGL